jgi:hypothetical protein
MHPWVPSVTSPDPESRSLQISAEGSWLSWWMCLSRSSLQDDLVLHQSVQGRTGLAAARKCQLPHVEQSARYKIMSTSFDIPALQWYDRLISSDSHQLRCSGHAGKSQEANVTHKFKLKAVLTQQLLDRNSQRTQKN